MEARSSRVGPAVLFALVAAGAAFVQLMQSISASESESLASTWYLAPLFFFGVFSCGMAVRQRFAESFFDAVIAPLGWGVVGAIVGLVVIATFHAVIWPLL